MNRCSVFFISMLLVCQIMTSVQDTGHHTPEVQADLDVKADFETSGRNGTSSGNNSTSDAHCLVLNNLTMNQTYHVSIYLVNICSDGINYPGINASSDNSGVDGLDEMWWYLIPGSNINSSNISDYPYYHMSYQLSLNQSIPNGTTITLYFEATVLHCGPNNSWSNDCPNSNNSNLSYQFTYPLGYNSTNNQGNNTAGNNTGGNNTVGNNTGGNNTVGNNTVGNNTGDNNSTATIPNYYFDNNYGLNFNSVSNIMNGTYVPTTVLIHNYENNSTTTDHMLAVTFYSDGHSEQKITQYVTPPVSRNTISISQYVLITSDTTYVEVSMDVLRCIDEYCDMSKTPEDRYYPADIQYYQSYSSTAIPMVVELSDEIFDLEPKTEEEQQNGVDVPRFTFEMEEVYGMDDEMYYRIVVTSCQIDLPTHHIFVRVIWSQDYMGTEQVRVDRWNLADPDRVYGFYPGNSNSSVTFLDQVDYNGDSLVSTFGVGDTIFIKPGFENGMTNDAIRITYDMYPEEDDGITLGAVLRSWDFGSSPVVVVDDSEEDDDESQEEDWEAMCEEWEYWNADQIDTSKPGNGCPHYVDESSDDDSGWLPSIGVFATLLAIGVGFVAATGRRKNE